MRFATMQQRGAIRRAIQLPCTLVRARDLKVVGRQGLDLSENGMLVGAMDELSPGDDVLVSFTFTQFRIPFNVEGRIARMLHGRRTRDRMPAVAMSFETMDPVSRLILRGNLRRVPPVLPARARRIDYAQTVANLLAEPHDPRRIAMEPDEPEELDIEPDTEPIVVRPQARRRVLELVL